MFKCLNILSFPDMTAWSNLYAPESVLKALEELNFSQPTPIQIECLPAAIRDRRDIVGAAHTVEANICCVL
jgi:ATP-dependent RNA helicase DDX24/MAK5